MVKFLGPIVVEKVLDFVLDQIKTGQTEHLGLLGSYLKNDDKRDARVDAIKQAVETIKSK